MAASPTDLNMLGVLFDAAMATEGKLLAFGRSTACHPDDYRAVVHAASGWRVFAEQLQDAAATVRFLPSADLGTEP